MVRDAGLVLLVDDEPLILRALARILRPDAHRLLTAERIEQVGEALADAALDVVLLDLRFGEHDGRELLARIKRERPELEVIVVTGHASVASAVDCMRAGAFDYVEKPFPDAGRVRLTVQRAIERRRLVSRNHELERELVARDAEPTLIGASPAMRTLQRTLASLRHNESTVLIQGESGTGKELVAAALHASSPRRTGPFVPVDCGALPESIIESELFGHERGAFTGALGAPGLFRLANGGTLFLDEIGEIPLAVQAKLLRALQTREVRPLGGSAALPVDIRVIGATNRDLGEMVAAGRFRRDLYYRLDVVRVELPPLRDREDDGWILAQEFLKEAARRLGRGPLRLPPHLKREFLGYPWPGNVREVRNHMERLALVSAPASLEVLDLHLPKTAGHLLMQWSVLLILASGALLMATVFHWGGGIGAGRRAWLARFLQWGLVGLLASRLWPRDLVGLPFLPAVALYVVTGLLGARRDDAESPWPWPTAGGRAGLLLGGVAGGGAASGVVCVSSSVPISSPAAIGFSPYCHSL
jgi:DNA-binding NtrC family response regulator